MTFDPSCLDQKTIQTSWKTRCPKEPLSNFSIIQKRCNVENEGSERCEHLSFSLSRNWKGSRKCFLLRHGAEKCLKKPSIHPEYSLPSPAVSAHRVFLPYWWLGTKNWRSPIQRGVGAVSVGAITDHPLLLSCKDSIACWNCTPIHIVSLQTHTDKGTNTGAKDISH